MRTADGPKALRPRTTRLTEKGEESKRAGILTLIARSFYNKEKGRLRDVAIYISLPFLGFSIGNVASCSTLTEKFAMARTSPDKREWRSLSGKWGGLDNSIASLDGIATNGNPARVKAPEFYTNAVEALIIVHSLETECKAHLYFKYGDRAYLTGGVGGNDHAYSLTRTDLENWEFLKASDGLEVLETPPTRAIRLRLEAKNGILTLQVNGLEKMRVSISQPTISETGFLVDKCARVDLISRETRI